MDEYIRISQKKERFVIGVMSGTSLDGLDIALVKILGTGDSLEINQLEFRTYPMPDNRRIQIQKAFNANTAEICKLNYDLGFFFGDAITTFCQQIGFDTADLDIIGCHGQTIYHVDRHSTMQLGESALIAEKTRTLVVSDFRSADIAVGGSGAPLVPYVDQILYRDRSRNVAIQNIGGIGNVTFLPADDISDIIAFDTGPGNAVLNELCEMISNGQDKYDVDGKYSSTGTAQDTVLADLLAHDYFQSSPPKSTGREVFGRNYVESLLKKYDSVSVTNLARTLVALIAQSMKDAYSRYLPHVDQIYICGGGAQNPNIMKELKLRFKEGMIESLPVRYHITPDSKEAVAFAIFAHERLNNVPTNVPSVTGARRKICLGKITAP